jgi:hypothetical protein
MDGIQAAKARGVYKGRKSTVLTRAYRRSVICGSPADSLGSRP